MTSTWLSTWRLVYLCGPTWSCVYLCVSMCIYDSCRHITCPKLVDVRCLNPIEFIDVGTSSWPDVVLIQDTSFWFMNRWLNPRATSAEPPLQSLCCPNRLLNPRFASTTVHVGSTTSTPTLDQSQVPESPTFSQPYRLPPWLNHVLNHRFSSTASPQRLDQTCRCQVCPHCLMSLC
jgi:hypothetical protein